MGILDPYNKKEEKPESATNKEHLRKFKLDQAVMKAENKSAEIAAKMGTVADIRKPGGVPQAQAGKKIRGQGTGPSARSGLTVDDTLFGLKSYNKNVEEFGEDHAKDIYRRYMSSRAASFRPPAPDRIYETSIEKDGKKYRKFFNSGSMTQRQQMTGEKLTPEQYAKTDVASAIQIKPKDTSYGTDTYDTDYGKAPDQGKGPAAKTPYDTDYGDNIYAGQEQGQHRGSQEDTPRRWLENFLKKFLDVKGGSERYMQDNPTGPYGGNKAMLELFKNLGKNRASGMDEVLF